MRVLGIAVSLFLALILAGFFLLPRLVSSDVIAAKVNESVRSQTGRDLAFSGMSFVFWPNIGVELKNVTFSNAPWAAEKSMVTVAEANVALALMPLLKREIEVKRFVLDQPVVHLEVGANGKSNWDFAPETKGATAAPAKDNANGSGSSFGIKSIVLKIKDGVVGYADRQQGTEMRFEGVNISASLPESAGVAEIKGVLTYKGKPLDINLTVERSGDFLDGKASPGALALKAPDMTAKLIGDFSTGDNAFAGAADIQVSSLSGLADWAGAGAGKPPFEKVSASGQAAFGKSGLALKDAKLALDDIIAQGNVKVDLTGTPGVTARLSLGKIDLDRFMGEKGGNKAVPAPQAASSGASSDWSAAPFDLSGMKAVDADVEVKAEGFSLKGIDVGASTLKALLKGGNLTFSSSRATLLSGAFSSEFHLNSAPAVPTMAINFDMQGVDAKPVLAAFASFDKLTGKVNANVSASSSGASQRDMISRLSGNGAVTFKDGALEGINLVDIARMAQQRLTNMGVGSGKTEFVELGGTFTIAQGIARNTDMKMAGPLVRATGSGSIDLPRKYLDFHVIPVLSASVGAEGAAGLSVPVDVRGPFSGIKVMPDFAGIVQGVAQDPKGALKNLKDQGKALEQNFKDIKKDLKQDPMKALQGIFGAPPAETPAAPVTEGGQ